MNILHQIKGVKQQRVAVSDMELDPAHTTPVTGASNSGSSQSTVVNNGMIHFTGIIHCYFGMVDCLIHVMQL